MTNTDRLYRDLLAHKALQTDASGMLDCPDLAGHLFDYQSDCVDFLLRVGRGGLFLDTGLGKTACELEWCKHAAEATNGRALILTPLAVAQQIHREAQRWGYESRVVRDQSDAAQGINICNYDRLHLLDTDSFGAVALDESSILKNFTGKMSRSIIAAFAHTPFRISASATPAPNDHMELGQHAEFCSMMASNEMLSRFFINDSSTASQHWRLKGHAVESFWDWMASWCRMATMPSDLGGCDAGFDLPPLVTNHHAIESCLAPAPGSLFANAGFSATDMHTVKRQTSRDRAECAASIIADDPNRSWVVWCDTDYEADSTTAALSAFDSVAEVRGSHTTDRKESTLAAFVDGDVRLLITKPSVCGFGLNWQHCARTVFVGRSFSYEKWYQAIRRLWRFGQTESVECHVVVAAGEEAIGRVIERKANGHESMKSEMRGAMKRAAGQSAHTRIAYRADHAGSIPRWMDNV